MAPRSKVHTLPPELKEWLDGELVARGFGDYVQLAADLKERGAQVSKSALQRYGSPFEKRMAQVKMSTEQARALVDAAPDDEDKLGAAVVRLTQERIFGLLVDLEIDPENVDVNKLFKNAAEIGKASVTQKKFSQSVRAEIEGGQSPLAHAAEARGEAVHAPAERVGGQIFKCSVVNGVKHRF